MPRVEQAFFAGSGVTPLLLQPMDFWLDYS